MIPRHVPGLLLLSALPLLPCTKSGTSYLCTDTGNPLVNGERLQAAILAADCGETIVLPAGALFDTRTGPKSGLAIAGSSFILPEKKTPACSATNPSFVTITSNRAEELPTGIRVSPVNESQMAQIRSTSSYPAMRAEVRAHHYRLSGLLFSSAPNVDEGCASIPTTTCTASSFLFSPPENYASVEDLPHDIVIERSIFRPHNPNALFASASGGIQWEGRNLTVRDSYLYGFTGWQVNVSGVSQALHTASAITSAHRPTVTLSPGTASLPGRYVYEFGGWGGDYARLNGFKTCDPRGTTNTCSEIQEPVALVVVEPGGTSKTVQMITAAPHQLQSGNIVTVSTTWPGLACMNGATVAVTRINEFRVSFAVSGCTAGSFDNTQGYITGLILSTAGLSGTTGWVRMVEKGNLYGFLSVGGPGPITFENNYVNAQFAAMFFGGGSNGGFPDPNHTGTINSVEGNGRFVLSHVTDMQVNDVITIYNSSNQPCQAQVTAINGTQISTIGAGSLRPSSSCVFTPGKLVFWRGYNISNVTLRRNTFEMDFRRNHMGHKGYIEVKSMTDALVEGNQFIGEDDSQHIFFTVRNDNGSGPWVTAERITIRNNIFHSGGHVWTLYDGQNGVATQWNAGAADPQNRYENNLHVSAIIPPLLDVKRGSLYYRHNSWIMPTNQKRGDYPTNGPTRIAQTTDCGAYPQGVRPFQWLDNIVNYGAYGFVALGNNGVGCWELTKAGNIFVNNFSQSINEPGNRVAANVAALGLSGTCDAQGENWRNCRLGAGSTFKGAASDGKDPGVDMEELQQQVLGWYDEAQVRVTPEAQRARIQILLRASSPSSGCKLELFLNPARTLLHGDTNTGERQICSRSGSVISGQQVELVLGTNDSLTPATAYWWKLTDGGRTLVGSFATLTTSGGTSSPGTTPVLLAPAIGTVLNSSAVFQWSNTGAAKYRLEIGRTASATDLFLTETTATSQQVNGLPQDGSVIYVRITPFAQNTYLAPVTASFVTQRVTSPAPPAGTGLRFVPVTPCRLADTRLGGGSFGAPSLAAGSTRAFPVPSGACNIPTSAKAYSLNLTVVPKASLAYVTVWPTGQAQPNVSTLNAFDGGVTSNAAIVPAGPDGGINVYATANTDVVLDINGYFASPESVQGLVLHTINPCRLADTRLTAGAFGGPAIGGGGSRDFPVQAGSCGIPFTAQAYAFNATVAPQGNLSYLTIYPQGQSRPNVSTLNSFDGSIKANAAIVPAGSAGSISVFATDTTHAILDVNAYFAPPGSAAGGLHFYPVTPCRVVDTRTVSPNSPYPTASLTYRIPVPSSPCAIPSTALAYSVNVTVIPATALSYLTLWPGGAAMPAVSTLNSPQGTIRANAAIVPAGSDGSVSVFVTDSSYIVLDINGYFAP